MYGSHARLLLTASLLAAMAVTSTGCADDDPTQPPLDYTLENVWPSSDGTSWIFEGKKMDNGRLFEEFDSSLDEYLFDSPEDVPPAPGFDRALVYLDDPPEFILSEERGHEYEYQVRLQFDGPETSEAGLDGQRLRESYSGSVPCGDGSLYLLHGTCVEPEAACPDSIIGNLERCSRKGTAWKKTEDWVGVYGFLDTDPSDPNWKFLTSDLEDGAEFSLHLVPELADNIFLHVRVRGRVDVETPAGRFEDALEVIYIVDSGVQGSSPEAPDTAFWRSVDLMRIVYAAGVGPVTYHVRGGVLVGDSQAGATLGPGFLEERFNLASYDIPQAAPAEFLR